MNQLHPVRKQQTALGAFFKWATIGFLGLIAMLLIFGGFLLTRLFPLMETGGDGVKFFGGSLQIREHDEQSDNPSDNENTDSETNAADSQATKLQRVNGSLSATLVSFETKGVNGRVKISSSKNQQSSFDCEVRAAGAANQNDFLQNQASDAVVIEFSDEVKLSWCDVVIPATTSVNVKLVNGEIRFNEMSNPVDGELVSGSITFNAAPMARYELDAKITSGRIVGRESFDTKQRAIGKGPAETYRASLRATNGVVVLE